jgi:hypothetical protein
MLSSFSAVPSGRPVTTRTAQRQQHRHHHRYPSGDVGEGSGGSGGGDGSDGGADGSVGSNTQYFNKLERELATIKRILMLQQGTVGDGTGGGMGSGGIENHGGGGGGAGVGGGNSGDSGSPRPGSIGGPPVAERLSELTGVARQDRREYQQQQQQQQQQQHRPGFSSDVEAPLAAVPGPRRRGHNRERSWHHQKRAMEKLVRPVVMSLQSLSARTFHDDDNAYPVS